MIIKSAAESAIESLEASLESYRAGLRVWRSTYKTKSWWAGRVEGAECAITVIRYAIFAETAARASAALRDEAADISDAGFDAILGQCV